MKIVAILAFRNEEAYLANVLRHLARNGIDFALVDNTSTDNSRAIALSGEFASRLVTIVDLEFDGAFDLTRQLEAKAKLAAILDADWIIHCDADEILHSYRDGETLFEAISRVDRAGYNAIDFNEFVFLPLAHNYEPSSSAEYQPVRSYYFFENTVPPRLMRTWKKAFAASMIVHGGHRISGSELRLTPEKFALRHYIVTNQEHAFRKYTTRRFADGDRRRGWHGNRVNFEESQFRFPPGEQLHWLSRPSDRMLDTSAPRRLHFWQW